MRWTVFLLLYVLMGSALAWPIDLKINPVSVKTDDAAGFDIYTMMQPGSCQADYIIPLNFNDSARVEVYFAVLRSVDGLNILDSNDMRLDPVRDTALADLVTYGSYNASIGGHPGVVTWRTYTDGKIPGQDNYVSAKTEIIGIASVNGTEIAVKSKDSFPTYRMTEDEISSRIVEVVGSFNKTLQRIEVNYVQPA